MATHFWILVSLIRTEGYATDVYEDWHFVSIVLASFGILGFYVILFWTEN